MHRPRVTLVVAQEANDTRLGAWKSCGEWKGSAIGPVGTNVYSDCIMYHWVGLRENLQETPISNGKNHGFL